MANRPIYVALEKFPYVERVDVEFKFYSGFALSQKRLSIQSLHRAFQNLFPDKTALEISTKSEDRLGVELSAFNLQILLPKSGKNVSVESAFQSSKVFENGGPFRDLLYKSSYEAKTDSRLRNSGALKAFQFFNTEFPLEPKTYFYTWLYINALIRQRELAAEILKFDALTDIECNPKKTINTQAEAAAVFIGLNRAGLLDAAVKTKEDFLKIVYRGDAG